MIHLVVADASHTDVITQLVAALFSEVEHWLDETAIAEFVERAEADDRHSTLLAFDDDGDAVGVLTIVETLSLSAGGYMGVLNELYVVPPYRSEGVGSILLDAAKSLGEQRGWTRLEVTTPGDEYAKTLHFYEREGFSKIGPRYRFIFE